MIESLPERPFRPGMYRFKVLAKHLPLATPGAAWLNLGGGAREFSVLAAEQGHDVTLVDGDEHNIADVAEEDGYRYRFFTVAGTRALCEKAGFEVLRMEFSSPTLGFNWVRRRLLGRSERLHVRVTAPVGHLFAQTIYVVGRRP